LKSSKDRGANNARRSRLHELPLDVLRERLCDGPVRPSVLRALSEDLRAGARVLLAELERRRARELAERARLRTLYRADARLRRGAVAHLAGVDECGMGPLAGPVVAAAVILPPAPMIPGIDDSKRLTGAARTSIAARIRKVALAFEIGVASTEEIDRLNIYWAGRLAMCRAVQALSIGPDLVALDGRGLIRVALAQRAFVDGDARFASIAAASIVAKVHRDALMCELDARYPGYGFAHNCGYATPDHLEALRTRGPTPEHRRSFAPVDEAHRRAEVAACRMS
jgi:ribonuclease HII